MYHSVTFGEKNTWDDWRLVPVSRPLFNPPAQKVKTLEIPGGDGLIDLSTALSGYPVYQNRTGSMEFYVMNDFKPWQTAYSDIMDYLHGQTMRAVLEDDPEYFYEGRFTVNAWKSEKDWSKIVIDYSVGPYKWSAQSSTDDWLWDTFNFQNGVIRSAFFKNIRVREGKTLEKSYRAMLFGRAPVCPVFRVASSAGNGVHARFVNPVLGIDEEKLLRDGSVQVPEFIFSGGAGSSARLTDSNDGQIYDYVGNPIMGDAAVSLYLWCDYGTGTVSIEFRNGRL